MKKIKHKKYLLLLLPICLVVFSFVFGHFANADSWWNIPQTAVDFLVGGLCRIIILFAGYLLIALIYLLIWVAQYNGFISSPAVTNGWVIVRDLCNMFFILALLIIAFATILKLENYSIKKMLPKLIIMAILINFSKMICGLIIDFAQVIMLTFVNGFKELGGGYLTDMLGVKEILKLNAESAVDLISISSSYILAVIYVLISVVVIGTFVYILVWRMVMLWIYIVLSPLAYLLAAVPGGQKYSSQWWSEFTKNVIVGPLLAFFIWLSLVSLSSINTPEGINALMGGAPNVNNNDKELQENLNTNPQVGLTEAGTPEIMIMFIISIGMLMGGLIVTQQIGAQAGSAAGKGMAAIQKGQALAWAGAKISTSWAGRKLDVGQQRLQSKLGIEAPRSLNYRIMKQGWDASRDRKMRKYEEGASERWQDTFTKWTELETYPNIGKTKGKIKADNEEADKLEKDNEFLDYQIRLNKAPVATDSEKQSLYDYMNENKDKILSGYIDKKGMNREQAERKFEYEHNELIERSMPLSNYEKKQKLKDNEKLKKEKEKNESKAEKLRRDYIGFGRRFRPDVADVAYEKSVKESQAEIETKSQDSASVVTELIDALDTKNHSKMIGALNVLAKNNDINEALKDTRVQKLMTKSNGLLEKILGDQLSEEQLAQVKQDYKQNNVTPAYAQAMIQGMMKQSGISDRTAAQYISKIGETSISGGNGLMYGAVQGNANTGGYEFDKMVYKDGKMEISDSRKGAIIGKLNNFESQAKIRSLHPDTIIKEGSDGSATGIHEGGLSFLKSLTTHDLGQINRLRLDVINKIGNSDAAMADIKKLVSELESSENAQDRHQAEMIKYFAGYIKSRVSGGTEKLKDSSTAMDAWNNQIANM